MDSIPQKFADENALDVLPNVLTAHMKSLLKKLKKIDTAAFKALEKQFVPSEKEHKMAENDLADPLGEALYTPVPRLVHRYKNRCLLLATDRCLSYCRYCFRRSFTSAGRVGFITESELEAVCAYLLQHTEVEELLVSGGDPLTAADDRLAFLFEKLRLVRSDLLLRLCTRANVFMPERFTRALVLLLKKMRPLWVIPHINHSAELVPKTVDSLCRLIDSGIPVQSQTVLLRGVNDSVPVLEKLFTTLVKIGVKPGYLFQADLAQGTAHFRVSVEEGLLIYDQLRQNLSGLSLPVYAVDLPGGGGKFNMLELDQSVLAQRVVRADMVYEVEKNGKMWYYPRV